MDLFLYNLINSELFWIFVVLWVILGVMWTKRLSTVLERLKFLVIMPPFSKDAPDDYPQDPPQGFFYPRRLFVDIARLLELIAKLVRGQHDMVWDSGHKMRTFVFFILFVALCAFIFADYVAVANGLSAIFNVDLLLTPLVVGSYGLAVSIATLLSFIVGFFVFIQALVQEPLMLFKADSTGNSRKIKQIVGVVVSLIALFVGTLIGIERLIALGYLPPNSTFDWLAQFGVHVLILVNGTLSAGLIGEEALYGLVVLLFIVGWIVIIVGGVARHLIDYVLRLVFALLDLLLYFLFAPIQGLVAIVGWGISGIWSGGNKAS